jgi:multidrug efflux pump
MVSAYWVKLASSIVYGLSFAAVLTLVITPALLIVPQALNEKIERLRLRFNRSETN